MAVWSPWGKFSFPSTVAVIAKNVLFKNASTLATVQLIKCALPISGNVTPAMMPQNAATPISMNATIFLYMNPPRFLKMAWNTMGATTAVSPQGIFIFNCPVVDDWVLLCCTVNVSMNKPTWFCHGMFSWASALNQQKESRSKRKEGMPFL